MRFPGRVWRGFSLFVFVSFLLGHAAIQASGQVVVTDNETITTTDAGAIGPAQSANAEPITLTDVDTVTTGPYAPTISKAFTSPLITQGGNSTVTLTLGNTNGTSLMGASFTDTLTNMSAAGGAVGGTCAGTIPGTLTGGATALSFSGITIPAGGCTVTFSVTSTNIGSNPNTTSGVTTTQTPAAGTVSNTAFLTVISAGAFAISASPNFLSVAQGASGATTITLTPSGGFASATTLSVSGQPAGVTAVFNPPSIAAPASGSSTLTLTVPSSTPAGRYLLTLIGTGGGLTETMNLPLTVTAPFSISGSPSSVSVAPGTSGTSTITTVALGGFSSAIALSAGQLTGVTVSFNPTSVAAPGSGSSTMTMAVAASAAPGLYPIIVTGTGGGFTNTTTVTLTVSGALTVSTTALPNGQTGVAYSAFLSATGGTAPYTWALTSRRMPAGLTLNPQTGQISGTPTALVTNMALAFTVTDSTFPTPQTASASLTITVTVASPTLTITTTSLPNGKTGVPYSAYLSATGGTTPYTWTLTSPPTLPAGLTLNSGTGQISGTPATAVPSTFLTFQVTDSTTPLPHLTATVNLTLTIVSSTTLTITTASLPNGQTGAQYLYTLAATGGTAPYAWALTTPRRMPLGLTLNAPTGQISGTPVTAATNVLTFTVTDSSTPSAQAATVILTLTVTSP